MDLQQSRVLTLGILIHKVTGIFYGDILQRRIFGPLGMSTTRILNEADIIPNRSAGYRLADGHLTVVVLTNLADAKPKRVADGGRRSIYSGSRRRMIASIISIR